MAEEEVQLSTSEITLLVAGAILISFLTVFFVGCYLGKNKQQRAAENRAQVEEMKERRASRRVSANNEWLEDALRAAAEIEGAVPGRRSIQQIDADAMGRRRSVSSVRSEADAMARRRSVSSARSEAGRQSRRGSMEGIERERANARSATEISGRAAALGGFGPARARAERSASRSQSAGATFGSPSQPLRSAAAGGGDDMATLADLAAPGGRAGSPASGDSGRALVTHPPGLVPEDSDLEAGAEALEQEVRAMARQAATPSASSRRQTKAFVPMVSTPDDLTPQKVGRSSRRPSTQVLAVDSEPEAEPWGGAQVSTTKSSPLPRRSPNDTPPNDTPDRSPKDDQRWARTPASRRTLTASLKSAPPGRSPTRREQAAQARFFLDVDGAPGTGPTLSRVSTANTDATDASIV